MKLKHTPGPWTYEKGDEDSGYGGRHFVSHPETECDATTICETNHGEHDARLIAAAPDMIKDKIKDYNEIGKWLSASLDDPNVCDEMKKDVRAWFDRFKTFEEATGYKIEEVLK